MMAGDEMVRPDLFPRRDDLRADLCAVLAARVEFAALRRVDRAGDIAFEDGELLRADGIRRRDGVEQGLGVRMDRVVEDLVGLRQLDHVAEVHDADAVGDVLDDGQVVRDEHVGQVLVLLEVEQQVDDLGLNRHVQRGNSLVADDELRVRGERTGDADALPLSAGELVREAVQEVRREAAFVHDVQDELLHTGVLFLDHVVRLHALADDLADAHARVQRGIRILENELHIAAQAAHLVIAQARKVDAAVAVGLVLLELRVLGVGLAHLVDLRMDLAERAPAVGDLRVDLLELFPGRRELSGVGLLGLLPGGKLQVVHVDRGALPAHLQVAELLGLLVGALIDLHDGLQVLGHEEAADDLGDVEQRVLGELSRLVELPVLGVLLLLGKGGILRLERVALLLELAELFAQLWQVADGLQHIARGEVVQGHAVVHGAAVGLVVELKDGAPQRGLAAAGPPGRRSRPCRCPGRCRRWP